MRIKVNQWISVCAVILIFVCLFVLSLDCVFESPEERQTSFLGGIIKEKKEEDSLQFFENTLLTLYKNEDDPRIYRDLENIKLSCNLYKQEFEGLFCKDSWTPYSLHKALATYSFLIGKKRTLEGYVNTLYAKDPYNLKLKIISKKIKSQIKESFSKIDFIIYDVKNISEKCLLEAYASVPSLLVFKPWLKNLKKNQKFKIPRNMRHILSSYASFSKNIGMQFFDEYSPYKTIHKDKNNLLNLKLYGGILAKTLYALEKNTDNLSKDYTFVSSWEKALAPIEGSEKKLRKSLKFLAKKCAHFSNRYYSLKRKFCGGKILSFENRNQPFFKSPTPFVPLRIAHDILNQSLLSFDSEITQIAQFFFKERRVEFLDSLKGKNKAIILLSADYNPIILTSYHDSLGGVLNLSKALGKGIGYSICSQNLPDLLIKKSLLFEEICGGVTQLLVFDFLQQKIEGDEEKIYLLSSMIEIKLKSLVQPLIQYEFEKELYPFLIKNGFFDDFLVEKIWINCVRRYLGPFVSLNKMAQQAWMIWRDLFNRPFQSLQNILGVGVADSLFHFYKNETLSSFEEKYKDLMKKGHWSIIKRLKNDFNIDIYDLNFWEKSCSQLESWLNTLEILLNKNSYKFKKIENK